MSEKMKFDYFYGSQAEQFSFFRLPKVLIRDERFKKISSDAKILYGIMLDRMSLSRENKWIDDANRVFIIFTLKDVMKEFECCQRKAGALMAELDTKSGIGLIEKKKQGLGKPDLIYLKNFIVPQEIAQTAAEKEHRIAVGEVVQLQSGKNVPLKDDKAVPYLVGKSLPTKEELLVRPQSGKNMPLRVGGNEQFQLVKEPEIQGKTEEMSQSVEESLFQSGKNMPVQSCTNMPLKSGMPLHVQSGMNVSFKSGIELPTNNTDNNKTDFNKTESIYPINPPVHEDGMDMIEKCTGIVKENIDYDSLCSSLPLSQRMMLEDVVQLMVEILAVERNTVRVAGTDYPYAFVKSRFLALKYEHVEYVLNCLNQTSNKIGNIKAYMLTSLFNAPVTIDTFYTAEVHHDMGTF